MNKYKKTYIIIAITTFIVCISFILLSFYERNKTVKTPIMYVGEEPVTKIEYTFYYNTIINNFYNTYSDYLDIMGLDFSNDLYSQNCYFKEYDSWGTFFEESTLTALQSKIALYKESQKQHYEYDTSESYKTFKEQIKEQAESNKISTSKMYETLFGQYATEKQIKQYYVEYITATAYENYLLENVKVSDEEIEKYYNENSKLFDTVTYREYIIKADIQEDDTEENIEKAMQNAKEKALNFYNNVYDEETFINLCVEYSGLETYKTEDKSLYKNKSFNDISGVISDWLFKCTEEKQTTLIEDNDNHSYHIVYFINKNRDETSTVSMRHILVTPKISNITDYLPTEEDYQNALNKVEDIKEEFISKGANEDNFKELAIEYSEDKGTSYNGGLMANVSNGEWGTEIDNWLFSNDRQYGDYEILKSAYGYHLIFFIEKGEPSWKFNIRLALNSQKNDEYIENLLLNYPITYPN